MFQDIPEADWKIFRTLREVALERFCERVLNEVKVLASASDGSFHERYLELYRRIEHRDKELARAFDDARGSKMVEQLVQMRVLHLVDDEVLAKFSPRTRELVAFLADRK